MVFKWSLIGDGQRPPWLTEAEYEMTCAFVACGHPQTVERAYFHHCREKGIEPRRQVPKEWRRFFRLGCTAYRKAQRQLRAIEKAASTCGIAPDWDKLEQVAREGGLLGNYDGEIGKVMDSFIMIECAFLSLNVDHDGKPL